MQRRLASLDWSDPLERGRSDPPVPKSPVLLLPFTHLQRAICFANPPPNGNVTHVGVALPTGKWESVYPESRRRAGGRGSPSVGSPPPLN